MARNPFKLSDVKRFGGLAFRRLSTHRSKRNAEKVADVLRRRGDKARVVKRVPGRWEVFTRSKSAGPRGAQAGDRPRRRRRRR